RTHELPPGKRELGQEPVRVNRLDRLTQRLEQAPALSLSLVGCLADEAVKLVEPIKLLLVGMVDGGHRVEVESARVQISDRVEVGGGDQGVVGCVQSPAG